MNDPNKAINVNLSSLLSLKAELIRKQAEVSKAKATRVTVEDFTPNKIGPTKGASKKQSEPQESVKKSSKDSIVCEYDDPALLEKSQKTLEAKTKYYERMQRTGANTDENCLVQFKNKQQDENDSMPRLQPDVFYTHSSSSSDTEDEDHDDDEEDWVEYTDCLGRTRKCLRNDLDKMLKQDKDLAASMPERLDQSKANWMLDIRASTKHDDNDTLIGPHPAESIISEDYSVMSKHDEMRANWGKKQIENLEKTSVHYQDVFFDEARQHGVGYYAFSTDEAERAKQQRELEEARKQTISEQEHRDKLKAQREKIIAERVRAAKNRQRARLGLPPLEENDDGDSGANNEASAKETKEERRERKRLEKAKRKAEKLEAEQELLRKHHVRPWDKEKDGKSKSIPESNVPTDWQYKPERLPMSQEEWNESKRAERNPEFAPLSTSSNSAQQLKRTNFKSTTFVAPMPKTDDAANYQSYNTTKHFQRRSYQLDDSDRNTVEEQEYERSRRGAAIPPPSDLDSNNTFLPPHAKKSKTAIELEKSIEAGLRFLRNNSDKNTLTVKSTWTSKADY